MIGLSEKVAGIAPSATIEISNAAKRMAKEGIDVISLSIGEPDFDTPEHIKDACINALRRGETHYAPSAGIPELTAAIAEKITRENGFPVLQDEVIVTCGAKNAIYEAMEAVLNPEDEVLLLDPSWVSYEPCARIAGAKVRHHALDPATFQVDDTLLSAVGPRTRMIVVNSPSNPSGAVLDADSLGLIADICQDHDLFALSDEIYEKLVYGKKPVSLASLPGMAERTITVNGFSKAYAMTGWRIGYAVAPRAVIRQMEKVQQHTISHPTTFAMFGAVAALRGSQDCVESMRREFERRRDYIIPAFHDLGYATAPADGAFYAYVNVGGDDMAIARSWLHDAHVAVTPGTAFGTPGWLRVSYATSMENLEEAVGRIARV
ncbi:MAG TPA: pyridoxal phosphate-dependent aminotransferase [Candidatus Methanoculleus thermohydrogenotrophicum]|jgi:aspartate aminotransferase|nr:pyridoxal phosphate-dependent aminotransferase [Candidatus Methanoculleus thermohydrogenotrophicum]HOB17639.1 pyridoxal phosphate-dependent aminotransferase [Candidatus Methanoculleus thermohydrogenotrophicum]HPZ37339.1 pyridoxal phosphate-dependent aminotransferase [Candidatus Methanoculleus thermohydrogenotrophicum]HQC91142.1 pyridoxal phosphate-dependent aminotransferase [Candidatus Methanoculleus thermohydrogenotrophicum]